ncbi:MAG: Gfo/Idh/MocA family oxidoreductase [Candidatus Latescibacteria bacterium]|jgi:predicted dehydrogenase|nr:Gfo/Idh/MocA family oxidoreductase [Candidatus Latescibacterota bacterium]
MSKKIGIGIIGMGWMGQAHSRSYLQVPLRFPESGLKPHLVICSDNVPERAEQARETIGFDTYTTNWQEVIDRPDVQVVNITTPNNLHVEIVRAAASAGKQIFCEKPVGRTPEETAQIAQIARETKINTCVGYNYRYAPMVQHAHNLMQSGQLGDLTHYRGRFFFSRHRYGPLYRRSHQTG